MEQLPRFMAMESHATGKYVHFAEEEGDTHALLKASGEMIISPYAKLEVERAKSDGRYVNIRCCYNNRYWVRSSRRNVVWIACEANEPQEDTSHPTCTLFEPLFTTLNNRDYFRFRFVAGGGYLHPTGSYVNRPEQYCLNLVYSVNNRSLFSITDWDVLFILPKYVTFKGDNEEFLSARTIQRQPYLQFSSKDIGDPTVGNEVFTLRNGAIRVKSDHFGRFWRRSPNWIWADSNDTTADDPNTVFWPIRVSRNVVALRNLANNLFCKRLTADGQTSCLSPAVRTIDLHSRLEIHETVLSRDISNVQFRLMDARIYGETVVSMDTAEGANRTPDPGTITILLRYTETESRSFNSTVTLKLGVETTIKTGIPVIAEGQVTTSFEFEGTMEWGTAAETTKEVETSYTATVPPWTRLRVRLLATRGRCDVPFTYLQKDTLTNGHILSTPMDDGVYTGANSFNFIYEVDELPMSQSEEPLSEEPLVPSHQPLSLSRKDLDGLLA